ncbi:hypothetical protein PFISCL1PPCAC_14744, partial [Pristionchus fissidentatus]
MDAASIIGGSIFSVLSVIGLFINCLVLYAIFKGRLLFKEVISSNSVYIFSLSSIAMDNLMIVIHIIYLIPSVFLQLEKNCILFESWLFPDGATSSPVVILSFIFMYCWYYTTLSHILISTTRYESPVM